MIMSSPIRLVCPAGNLPAMQAALEAGADAVYCGLRDSGNARAFPGLNFSIQDLRNGIVAAHARQREVYLALNTYSLDASLPARCAQVDMAAELGVDAIIAADLAVLDHAARRHPQMARHLSVQGSATTAAALRYLYERVGITRAVLPRVLSIRQVEQLCAHSPVPLEVFAFGSLCIMAEGRCHLSSHLTGASPNVQGVCSPASAVQWREQPDGQREVRLNGVLIDRFTPDEPAGYPTVCKGRYRVRGTVCHALEEPTSLNTLDLLPRLAQAGVAALKIEGRQRGAAYVRQVTAVWRTALDQYSADPQHWQAHDLWRQQLSTQAEGHQTTLGAYDRGWQ